MGAREAVPCFTAMGRPRVVRARQRLPAAALFYHGDRLCLSCCWASMQIRWLRKGCLWWMIRDRVLKARVGRGGWCVKCSWINRLCAGVPVLLTGKRPSGSCAGILASGTTEDSQVCKAWTVRKSAVSLTNRLPGLDRRLRFCSVLFDLQDTSMGRQIRLYGRRSRGLMDLANACRALSLVMAQWKYRRNLIPWIAGIHASGVRSCGTSPLQLALFDAALILEEAACGRAGRRGSVRSEADQFPDGAGLGIYADTTRSDIIQVGRRASVSFAAQLQRCDWQSIFIGCLQEQEGQVGFYRNLVGCGAFLRKRKGLCAGIIPEE